MEYRNILKPALYLTAIHEGKWSLIAKNIKRAKDRIVERAIVVSCIDEYAQFHNASVEDLIDTLDASLRAPRKIFVGKNER